MANLNRQRLIRELRRLLSGYSTRPNLVPALMGVYLNGLKTIQVSGRKDFIWVRVRGSNSDILQVFNEKVQRHWDLPILIYRDDIDNGIWKVWGRDLRTYEDWGGVPYVIDHGTQHSFSGGSTRGRDITWVYKRQIVPLMVRPNATATMSVFVESDYYFFDEQFKFWPGSGTADLSSYKPTGSLNGKFLTVWLQGSDGSLQLTPGTEFNMLSATEDPATYIAPPPANLGFPLGAVLLQTGTARIGWGELYDVRQFVSQPPSAGLTVATKTSDYSITINDLTILCDASGGAFTISLLTASGNSGRHYHIKKIDSSANAITIDPDGSETIDGDITVDIATQYESLHLVSDGSDWHVI